MLREGPPPALVERLFSFADMCAGPTYQSEIQGLVLVVSLELKEVLTPKFEVVTF
jgi:hypothetical protein